MTGPASAGRSAPRVVVIGAGPTGLGAAHRLQEIGLDDYVVLETSERVGGLARSVVDDAGFTHDIGGHVLFSHYEYYDRVVERALRDGWSEIDREASIWTGDGYVGYPYQAHLSDLPPDALVECLMGLVDVRTPGAAPSNFAEWMEHTFGPGITKQFMRPYNLKVWATPPEDMSFEWIAERVAVVDLEAVLRDVLRGSEAPPWGPNSQFRYPLRGGTGAVFESVAAPLLDHVVFGAAVAAVDPDAGVVRTADGRTWPYDALLSTMPLDELVAVTEHVPDGVRAAARDLVSSGGHVVGIGVDRPAATTRNWIYYPQPDVPFYRVTYLSNYSPYMTPAPDQTLLLTETSWSRHRPSDSATIVDEVVDGLVRVGLLTDDDRGLIRSCWRHSPTRTYPVPTIGRNAALGAVQPWLRERRVWSRGRFGAWLYEIGNMDHSFMQGVEWVDHLLLGDPEHTWIPRGEPDAPG